MEQKPQADPVASSVARLLEIDKVCRRFEAAWKSGEQPRLEDYVKSVSEPLQEELRGELESIEAEYRRASGEGLSLDVFIRRLTECGLMTTEEIQAFVAGLPASERLDSAEQLARAMYRRGKLTKFQAQALYRGKTKGLVMGNYAVLAKLAQGGMGQVYKAEHRKMERIVALKILPSSATRSPEAVKRFQREVKAAAKLSHPNIVTAFDADECDGLHFLVMEYVDGSDLGNLVRRHGPMPIGKAVDCVLQAARGLEYAHRKGIVHRDIKPTNLLRDPSGAVKVLDMGLARLHQAGAPGVKADGTLTQSGQVMGTLDFMSPEQAADTKLADARADVYSLGCTLYYLLAGRPPFGGDTLTQKILAHREDPIPSVRDLRPDVPQELDRIIRRMLAKQPDDRPQTMADVIGLLEPFAAPGDTGAPEVARIPAADLSARDTLNLTGSALIDTSSQPHVEAPVIRPIVPRPAARRRRSAAFPLARLIHPQRRILVGVAAGLGLVAIALGVLLSMKTPEGTVVVEIYEPHVTVQIISQEGKVILERAAGKGTLTLSVEPGTHRLRLEKDGLEVFAEEFTLAAGGKEIIAAKWQPSDDRSTPAPPPPLPEPQQRPSGPDAQSSETAAQRPSSPKWLGYAFRSQPASLAEASPYTNLVVDRGWKDYGDALLQHAREHDLRVVLDFHSRDRAGIEKKLVPLAKRYRDVVFAVCWDGPYLNNRFKPADLSTFGKQIKEALPEIEFWCSFVEAPHGRQQTLPVPVEVDTVVVHQFYDSTPAEIKQKSDRALPSWTSKAKERPVLLRWSCLDRRPRGLVPRCKPGTMKACAQAVEDHRLKGLLLDSYDAYPSSTAGRLVGIQESPVLLGEIQDIAQQWNVRKASPAPVVVDPSVASLRGAGERIVNEKDGSVLVFIPPGKFLAGREKFEVELPGYFLGLHPVTNAQYKRFVDATGHRPPKADKTGRQVWNGSDFPESMANHPVTYIGWEDAKAYCSWAGLRLPTELEWEKGARGVDGRRFPWGEEWDLTRLQHYTRPPGPPPWTCDVLAHPRGRSPWGLYNMKGLVFEWCADWYGENVYARYKQGDLSPPGRNGLRVMRGSCAMICPDNAPAHGMINCVDRGHSRSPESAGCDYGFRVAKTPTPEELETLLGEMGGWRPLFDGKTLDGWQGSSAHYVVEDGKLVSRFPGRAYPHHDGGNLLTIREYSDFVLRLEFKVHPGGNSGVLIRSPQSGFLSRSGMEIQILDHTARDFARLKDTRPWMLTGGIAGVAAPKLGHQKPPGQWNTMEILCKGRNVQVTLNDTKVLDADLDSLVDRPKDGDAHPGLRNEKGHIGFWGYAARGQVEYRNIRIKEL